MVKSHIIEFHTSKPKESFTTELLNKASNVPGLTHKHSAGEGHHNQSNWIYAKPTDYKLNIRKDGSFSSNTVGKKDVAKFMGKTLNIVKKFINNMLPKLSRFQAPIIVEDNNEIINRNEIRDLDPTTVDDNNNNNVEHANTVLKTNNILGAHIMEKKKNGFINVTTSMICGIVMPTHLRERNGMEMKGGGGGGTHSPMMLVSSKLPEPNIAGSQKQELWVNYLHQISRIFTLANINHKYGTFEANY